jgi:hypothetical protein
MADSKVDSAKPIITDEESTKVGEDESQQDKEGRALKQGMETFVTLNPHY